MHLLGGITPEVAKTFLPMIIMIVFFYFFMIRPQKKKENDIKEMRNQLKVGDEVLTIGGFRGKIIMVKEDYVVIESSGLNTRLDVMKWGIHSVTKEK